MARKKKKSEEPHENLERYLLTYSDMITLLMLFFIVLYSMSNIDSQKYKEMSEALSSVFSGGEFTVFSDQNVTGAQGIMQGATTGQKVKDNKGGKQSGVGGQSSLHARALSNLQNIVKTGKAKVIQTERGVTISLISDFQFRIGSSDLTAEAAPVVQEVADFLSQIPNSVIVEGHTDSADVDRSKWGSNWELSSARAIAVLRALQDYGVPATRLSAASYGSTRPLHSNDTAEGRAYNRRVDIVIIPSE